MNLHFIKAATQDIFRLIELEETVKGLRVYSGIYGEDEWRQELKVNTIYLIQKESILVGYFAYEVKEKNHIYISGLVVSPEYQGQGIARLAMEYLLSEVGEAKRVDLVTHPENGKAINLYASFGFVIESRKENYFGDGDPRVVMVKTI